MINQINFKKREKEIDSDCKEINEKRNLKTIIPEGETKERERFVEELDEVDCGQLEI